MVRQIVHIDMDAFFASVEQRDRPELRGKPVIVGGDPKGRGVVAAASYEARAFGVRSAISSAQAARLCPEGVFLPPDLRKYRAVSRQIHAIFHEVTDQIEPISLDEAYLDVSRNFLGLVQGKDVAEWLRQQIRARLHLTASAGVASTKLVAKVASDQHKPDGLTIVRPEDVVAFLAPLPVRRLWGVGPKTAEKLATLGLDTIGAIQQAKESWLLSVLGAEGLRLQRLALGQDTRPVSAFRPHRSSGAERTFASDVFDRDELMKTLHDLGVAVLKDLHGAGEWGRTLTLKVRYADFQTITRSKTLSVPITTPSQVEALLEALVEKTEMGERAVRLLGVTISGLEPSTSQLDLW